jgi:anti-sigma factor RsiW
MKCSKSKMVSPYLDDELTDGEKVQFESHVKGCPECSARLEAFQGMHTAFAGVEREKAPAWFSTRVRARVAGARPQRTAAFPLLVRFAEIAIVLLMITVGVISGGLLVSGAPGPSMGSIASTFSLEVFDPAPPDSVGGVYLAMTEANNAK